MEFTIVTSADLMDKGGELAGFDDTPAPKQKEPDNWVGRVIKEIPADVIAVYLAVAGIIKSINNASVQNNFHWVVFFLLLVMTPLYQWRVKKITKWLQIGLSTVAFLVWVFSIGGPFTQFTWYTPVLGTLILPVYTLLLAIIQPDR